jgi:endonuclease/exonuclease/phosphatase family metal-dependent hydrolase
MRNLLARLRITPQVLTLIEAGLIGLFFIQALRFLTGIVYSSLAGASAVLSVQAIGAPIDSPSAPDPATVSAEITLIVYTLALPLIGLILGRWRGLTLIAVVLVAVGRALMNGIGGVSPMAAAALTVSASLLYLALLVRHRSQAFPFFFILGISADQLLRAIGNTYDPSWLAGYQNIQIVLSVVVVLLALATQLWAQRREGGDGGTPGLLPLWGAIGIGSLLFLQLSLLAMPNAIAGRSRADYVLLVPLTLAASLLPIVPFVRARARGFIGLFDANLRGWLWMLLIILLIVFGTRFQGIAAGIALVLAQFLVSMIWWWLVRPRAEKERSLGGLWLLFGLVVFAALAVADNFTYEYAYVRDFTGNAAFLNNVITPLLRGFRGLGLGVILLGVFLAALPMTQIQRRIPWSGGSGKLSLAALALVAAAGTGAALAAQPPVVQGFSNLNEMRVGTYNIHSGFDEFYVYDLNAIAATIQESGANVVLLQEVEVGRMTSFGVDQALWLARRLGMDRRFFPTNEGIQGLAVLSNIPIAYDDGVLLSSIGNQTGLQRVQILPAPGTGVTIYNTWLGYLFELSGASVAELEQDQQRQLEEILTTVYSHFPNQVLGRVILGGTFNNVPDSPLIQTVRSLGFRDPNEGLPLELSATLVRSGLPRARFDYLWLYNLDSLGPFTMPSAASDHRMTGAGVRLVRAES